MKKDNYPTPRIPNKVKKLIDGFEKGEYKKLNINLSDDEFVAEADTINGERVIITNTEIADYKKVTMEISKKMAIPERRKTVEKLRKQGFNQEQIAKRLHVSQKTISNDIREIDR